MCGLKMMNSKLRKAIPTTIRFCTPFLIFCIFSIKIFASSFTPNIQDKSWIKNPLNLKYRSAVGPVIGIERGKFSFFTFGAEVYKTKGLIKPQRITGGFSIAYNFSYNVIDYKLYAYYKQGRLGLTYGIGACYISDFLNSRIGLSPQIGFKLLNFHLYTGLNLMFGSKEVQDFNKLFIGLNFFIPARHHIFK
jgi:hypothetical protein